MANKLRDLLVKEVSIVDRPANPGAKVLLAKRDDVQKDMYGVSRFADLLGSLGYLLSSSESEAEYEGDKSPVPAALRTWLRNGLPIFRAMTTEEVDEFISGMLAKREAEAKIAKGTGMLGKFMKLFKADALSASVKSIVADNSVVDKDAMIDETIKQFSDHVESEIKKTLSGGEPGDPSQEDEMFAALKKALGLADNASEADLLAAIEKKDADLKKASDDAAAAAELAKKAKTDDTVTKALADLEDLKKRNAVLEHERELTIFTKRAVAIGLPESQGDLLMKAHKGDAAALTKLEDVIKGLNEQIATGKVFAEFGTSHGSEVDAYAEITAKAAEIKKANPSLTIEKAKAKVIEDPANRDLVKRYNDERLKAHARAA